MALDLGKQVGPLPLGAWVIVVGAGLGIAYYTYSKPSSDPAVVESGNGTPGVGMGGSGQYTELTPVVPPAGSQKPTTNDAWGVAAINWLITNGYPQTTSDSAVRKYLAGVKMSVSEYTLINVVLLALGAPPQLLPPGEDQDPIVPPPVVNPPPTNPPPTNPPPATVKKYEPCFEGQHVDPWIADVNRKYNLSLNDAKLFILNPLLWGPQLITASKAGVGYVPVGTPGSVRTFGSSQSIRVV